MYQHHPAAAIFPLLPTDELNALAEDIRQNGLREPVWLWRDEEQILLLDGRNRIKACEAVNVEAATRFYTGDSPTEFVVSQNLHRRHLTPGQKAGISSKLEPMFAEEAARRKGGRPRKDERKPSADRREDSKKTKTKTNRSAKSSEKAAKATGASGRSVERYNRVVATAPDLAEKVDSGEMALDRAERIIRDREAEAKRVAEARKEAKQGETQTLVDIREGDFRIALAELHDIDAIITDPPYPSEFLPLLADLAKWADTVLKTNGVLAVLIGQTHLPEVYRLLSGFRPYRWTCCLLTPGPGYVSHPRKIQSNWKPVLIYGGGPRISDVIANDGDQSNAQDHHKWGQAYSGFHILVERLTKRGETIADPFMGSGTTLLAAHALGRHAIGCDTDAASVATARKRLL